ncbi:MAG: GtrA family protein [Pseudomonadota bacterium]
MWLAIKYAIFAVISIAVNLSAQGATDAVYDGPFELYLSLAAGTLAGLAVKYVLDKKFIFYYQADGLGKDGLLFILYSFMGVFTTLIFWGFEIGFDFLFQDKTMRYVGGFLGLVIGYVTKYHLDKKYVFRRSPGASPAAEALGPGGAVGP